MLIGGSSLHQIDLRGIASKADFVAAVQDAAGGLALLRSILHSVSWGENNTKGLFSFHSVLWGEINTILFTMSYWEITTPMLCVLFTVSYWAKMTPRLRFLWEKNVLVATYSVHCTVAA